MTCEAKQEFDEVACGRCGLRWAKADPDPPACGKDVEAVVGRADLSKALAALSATTESRKGLLHQANGAPSRPAGNVATVHARFVPGIPAGLATWPDTTERHDIPPPGQRRRDDEKPLQMLKFKAGWRMPRELPQEALDRMQEIYHARHGGGSDCMRAAYRELLDYLRQA